MTSDRVAPATKSASLPERLVRVERELERISERLHALTRRRDRLRDEATQLRCALTNADRDAYHALKTMDHAGEPAAR